VVPRPRDDELGAKGVPHAAGRVLRPATRPEGMVVDVWSTDAERPQSVPLPGCTLIGDPVWLDEGHFAIACAYVPPEPDEDPYLEEVLEEGEPPPPLEAAEPPPSPEQGWIYVVRIADAKTVAIPGTALGEHTGIYTLHAVPGAEGLDLLAVHPWGGKLVRVRSAQGPAALVAGAEATFAMLAELDAKAAAEAAAAMEAKLAAEAKGLPAPTPASTTPDAASPAPLLRPAFVPAGATVVALAPESLTVAPIDMGGEFDALSLSPDGKRLVFTTDRDHEVRVMPLDGGASTTIAKSPEARHTHPRFTADGKAVAFTSEFDGNDRAEQVGRLAVLGR
jgi:hypothetical protein